MSSKKVGILTILNCLNYGAVLQAYALNKKVRDLGYDCELLDLYPPTHPKGKNPEQYKGHPAAKKINTFKSRINRKVAKTLNSLNQWIHPHRLRLKWERFDTFKTRHMVMTTRPYFSVDDLYRHRPLHDTFIAGSDQIWSPLSHISSPEPFFLTFASKDQKRISYAPSFGVSSIPDAMKEQFKQWINNIDYVSVREKEGLEIVRNVAGRTAEMVLDPTFLLGPEDWSPLATEPVFKKPYILMYVLLHSPYICQLANDLSHKTGYSIVRIPRGNMREDPHFNIKNLYDAGPSEYLGLFKNASLILTSSFHGTAFSINYQKPFYSILRKGNPLNSRITHILEKVHLSSRLLYIGDSFPEKKQLDADYSITTPALQQERDNSLAFLTRSLEA